MTPTRWDTLLRCPIDGAGLLSDDPDLATRSLDGWSGRLTCGSCQTGYPVEDGIARFIGVSETTKLCVDAENEMVARDREAPAYDGRFSALRNALEVRPSLRAMNPLESDVVAELGCGTGRITRRYLPRVATVVALDISVESLRKLRASVPAELRERLLLVQADIARPPLRESSFTKVVSFQVIEHLPSAELRARTATAAGRLLARDGTLVASVYNWSRWKRFWSRRDRGDNTQKHGYHATQPPIYFFNFEEHEVRALFSALRVESLEGLCLQLPLISTLGWLALPIHRAFAATGFGRRHGHLLLVKATRPSDA